MKQIHLSILILTVALAAAACGGAVAETSKSSPANTAGANSQPATASKPAASGAGVVKNSTPTETGESFYNAVKAKDKTAFKQLMSEDATLILKAAAQAKATTLDDILDTQFFPNTPMPDKCEQRGEKITGDRATIEMKDAKGEWSPITYVKEGGVWKVSLE